MKIITFLFALLMLGAGAQAQTTVNLFFNGTKAGQYVIKKDATTGGISYKRKVFKNAEKLSIEVKAKSLKGPYIRTVEVMSDDKLLYTAPETEGVANQFVLSDKAVMKKLGKVGSVKLFLVSTPTDSTQAVKRLYIGDISATK